MQFDHVATDHTPYGIGDHSELLLCFCQIKLNDAL